MSIETKRQTRQASQRISFNNCNSSAIKKPIRISHYGLFLRFKLIVVATLLFSSILTFYFYISSYDYDTFNVACTFFCFLTVIASN